jgi:hypothetical protein
MISVTYEPLEGVLVVAVDLHGDESPRMDAVMPTRARRHKRFSPGRKKDVTLEAPW